MAIVASAHKHCRRDPFRATAFAAGDRDLESHVLQIRTTWRPSCDCCRYREHRASAGHDYPVRRSVRLQHILYLVEHHPEAAVSGSRAAYVDRMAGAYANAGDHEAVREQWLAAVAGSSEKHGGHIERREVPGGGRPGRCRADYAPRRGCRSG